MNELKEMILSGNIVAWVILVVLLVIFVKVLKSVGKGFLLIAAIVLIGFAITKFFPGIGEPIADFIRGGWLGE